MEHVEVRTSELTGPALDWAVAQAEGKRICALPALPPYAFLVENAVPFEPSTNWSHGGPIIERAFIATSAEGNPASPEWVANMSFSVFVAYTTGTARRFCTMRGPTVLVAAMRCYVASRLGDVVNVPAALLQG